MPFKPNWDEDLAKKAPVKHKVPVQELVQFHEKRVKHLAEDLFVETLPEVGYGSELREEDYDVQSGTPFFPSGIFTMKGQDVLYLVGLEKIVSKLSRDKKCNQPLENMQCHFCFTDFSPTWGRLEEEDDEKIVCERCHKAKLMKKLTKRRYEVIRYHSAKTMAEQLQATVHCTQQIREKKFKKTDEEEKLEKDEEVEEKENESPQNLTVPGSQENPIVL